MRGTPGASFHMLEWIWEFYIISQQLVHHHFYIIFEQLQHKLEGVPQTAAPISALQTTFSIKHVIKTRSIPSGYVKVKKKAHKGKNWLFIALWSYNCTALHCMGSNIQQRKNLTNWKKRIKKQKRNYKSIYSMFCLCVLWIKLPEEDPKGEMTAVSEYRRPRMSCREDAEWWLWFWGVVSRVAQYTD